MYLCITTCVLVFYCYLTKLILAYATQAEMKRFSGADSSVLKQHYEKKVHELEYEKKTLQVSMKYSVSVVDSLFEYLFF